MLNTVHASFFICATGKEKDHDRDVALNEVEGFQLLAFRNL